MKKGGREKERGEEKESVFSDVSSCNGTYSFRARPPFL